MFVIILSVLIFYLLEKNNESEDIERYYFVF